MLVFELYSYMLEGTCSGPDILGSGVRCRSHVYTGDNAHGHEHGNDGRTTITDKRKRQTDNREQTYTHTDINENLEQQHTGKSKTTRREVTKL